VLGAWRGVMAEGGLRGPRASAMFTVIRLANDQTLENITPGQGAPPWTWPRDELFIDVLHKSVYAFATGAIRRPRRGPASLLVEKLEQAVMKRPNSFMPAHTLERVLGLPQKPDSERGKGNIGMHVGQALGDRGSAGDTMLVPLNRVEPRLTGDELPVGARSRSARGRSGSPPQAQLSSCASRPG
jgi:hypothetical protein